MSDPHPSQLPVLHEKLARYFIEALESEGDPPVTLLKEIREFLKDNNITEVTMRNLVTAQDPLTDSLPTFDEERVPHPLHA